MISHLPIGTLFKTCFLHKEIWTNLHTFSFLIIRFTERAFLHTGSIILKCFTWTLVEAIRTSAKSGTALNTCVILTDIRKIIWAFMVALSFVTKESFWTFSNTGKIQ